MDQLRRRVQANPNRPTMAEVSIRPHSERVGMLAGLAALIGLASTVASSAQILASVNQLLRGCANENEVMDVGGLFVSRNWPDATPAAGPVIFPALDSSCWLAMAENGAPRSAGMTPYAPALVETEMISSG